MRPPATDPGSRRRRLSTLALIAVVVVSLGTVAPASAALDNGLSAPTSVRFDNQATGRTSAPKDVVITATGTAATTISTIELSGGQVGRLRDRLGHLHRRRARAGRHLHRRCDDHAIDDGWSAPRSWSTRIPLPADSTSACSALVSWAP